ncbi:MAG TPA: hypothetical protein VE967_19240 [Gemmatimonadaceae bacterium]|nr:hypothetical protein [Gemmatimonadaceae bacterium]
MNVPVPIPENYLGLVNRLLILAEQEPLVADTIMPILQSALDFALTSGKVTDPAVWVRAFEAASFEIANKKAAGEWLQMKPIGG